MGCQVNSFAEIGLPVNMEVLFGILMLNASRRNWRRYKIVPLDL